MDKRPISVPAVQGTGIRLFTQELPGKRPNSELTRKVHSAGIVLSVPTKAH
jgi:hypothetical protein